MVNDGKEKMELEPLLQIFAEVSSFNRGSCGEE
jgi:hypothetical protein